MKHYVITLIFVFLIKIIFCQSDSIVNNSSSAKQIKVGKYYAHKGPSNDRISIIAGPGASYISKKIYDVPVVNPTNNFVTLEEATRIKTNLSIGIVYTPMYYSIINSFKGKRDTSYSVRGISYSAFFNPIALSKVTENQTFFNSLDFGVGLGFRSSGGLLIMGTVEFFSVRQPRDWFINQFKNNNQVYIDNGTTNGPPQRQIDINDNNIFTNKAVITFGFKLCYIFSVVQDFQNKALELKNDK